MRESKNYAFVFQENENASNNNFEKGYDAVLAFDIKSFKERAKKQSLPADNPSQDAEKL